MENQVELKTEIINLTSQTIRAFKLDNLEDICEDYSQVPVTERLNTLLTRFFKHN